ncbi:MAG: DoxX family protein [Candidatus Pacebacteria bacterium]|nr:DoxX family protein [Candidatus Paceibacterota bacterium]
MKKVELKSIFHNKDFGLLIIRVVVGAIFVVHGYQKLGAMAMTVGFFGKLGFAPFLAYLVAWVEFMGGISLIIGYGSKIASALLAIVTLTAIVKVHGPNGFSVGKGGYEFVLSLFAVTVGLLYTGPGKYSIGARCGCPVKDGVCAANDAGCDCAGCDKKA